MKKTLIDVDQKGIFVKEHDRSYLQIEEIFSFKYHKCGLAGFEYDSIERTIEYEKLIFNKKPFSPKYKFINKQLTPIFNEKGLSDECISSFINYGYSIINGQVFSCTTAERNIFNSSKKNVDLKTTLKTISYLREKKRLLGDSKKIISELIDESIPQLDSEKKGVFPHQLYKYQRDGVQWLLHCYLNGIGTILADDMGLGKTAQIIGLIAEANERKLIRNALIVVPSTLLENWKREFKFFYPSVTPYLHHGPIRTGLSEELEKYKVVIVPYSILCNDIEMLVELTPDLLVFDEASLLKNPNSERTLSAKRLNASSTIAITGTPLENSLLDLWSIADLVFPGYLGSKEEFTEKYIRKDIQLTLNTDLENLEIHINQIMLRRLKVDYLDQLPSRIDVPQAIEMSEDERKHYNEAIATIKAKISDKGAVIQEINKLQQYTAHPILVTENKDVTTNVLIQQSTKFKRLIELLEQIHEQNEKVIIFANHHAMIDIICSAVSELFGEVVFQIDGRIKIEERQKIIDEFSDLDGFSVMVLNPRTAGMGLNITSANHVIHYSRQWNPALEEQATARAYRNGQLKEVNAYYLFYINTIEEVIDERLRLKKALSGSVVTVAENKIDEFEIILKYIGSQNEYN